MSKVVREFLQALDAEEAAVRGKLAADDLGILLRATINELDWYYYNLKLRGETSEEQEEQYYILLLGAPRLIRLALESRERFVVPTLTFRRSAHMAMRALNPIARLGFIEHGRRVADAVSVGLGRAHRSSDRKFEFSFPTDLADHGYLERSVREHYTNQSRLAEQRALRTETGKRHLDNIERLLAENVRPFLECFIAYDADPLLDFHFFNLAYARIQEQEGFDAFRGDLMFGGVTFQKYVLTSVYFLFLALKHEGFCEALVKKQPAIRLEDILTISAEKRGFIESIAQALDMLGAGMLGEPLEGYTPTTIDEANRIYEVLCVSRRNSDLLDRPGDPLPFAIEISDDSIVRSLAGGQISPVGFLMKSLRYHFPREYDKHQRTREASMQRALQRVLDHAISGLEYRQNIRVRSGRANETDVDLTILDRPSGIIVLCQLKAQDPFGLDMKAEYSRTGRLNAQVERWLATVQSWIDRQGEAGLRAALRLGKDFKVTKVYRLIVCANYAYSLRSLAWEEDTAYASWMQFFNCTMQILQPGQGPRSLVRFVELLREQVMSPPEMLHRNQGSVTYHLDEIEFAVNEDK